MNYYRVKTQDVAHNYQTLCSHTDALVVPMLKADGYGLGAEKLVEILEQQGASAFAFSRLEEALAVKTEKDRWVLTCYHGEQQLSAMIQADLVMAVDDVQQCKLISRIAGEMGKKARVHIAVDTGFGRFGFLPEQVEQVAACCKMEHIAAEGIFSHLSAAFLYQDTFAEKQLECFLQVVQTLEEMGITFALRHIANSSATLRDKKFHLDAVRVGSALLGRLPVAFDLPLKHVGTLVAEIVDLRSLKKGHNIGYGNVYKLRRDSRVAVLTVGTAEGIQLKKDYDTFRFRDFCRYGWSIFKMMLQKDNRMHVLINGRRGAVLGRVALTHMMVDVTEIECDIGDKAEITISPLYVADHVLRKYE